MDTMAQSYFMPCGAKGGVEGKASFYEDKCLHERVMEAMDAEFNSRTRLQQALCNMVDCFHSTPPTSHVHAAVVTEEAVQLVRKYALAMKHTQQVRTEMMQAWEGTRTEKGQAHTDGYDRSSSFTLHPSAE
jgi:hypothetical protein